MARSAADLSLLLDVIAGPDPLDNGVGYKLALPPPRHTALKDFRVLVIDSDPVMPADKDVRDAIEKLAGNLARSGVSVARHEPAAAGFRGVVAALYADADGVPRRILLAGGLSRARRPAAAQLTADDRSLAAERLRGIDAKPSRLGARRRRARPAARAMARTVQHVRCGDLPDHADAGLSARSFAGLRKPAASRSTARTTSTRINWRGPASPPCPACRPPRSRSACRRQGLPVGVQIVGPWLEDRTPLKLAELIEREFGGFVPPPMFDD